MVRKLLAAFSIVTALTTAAAASTDVEKATNAALRPYHGTVSTQATAERTVIAIRGVITPDVAKAFQHALAEANDTLPLVIELDSPGGFTKSGYRMIDAVLRERAEGHRVSTLVRGNARCESMCVGLFMAGDQRFAEPGARFMVHAPRSDGDGTISVRATRRMIDRLVSLGVSKGWIRQAVAAGAFSGTVDYYKTAEELDREGANVITALRTGG